MSSHEQETSKSTQETETYSDAEMSSQASAETIAIANQQEWAEEKKNEIDELDNELAELLDDFEQQLESEEFLKAFIQQGGQ